MGRRNQAARLARRTALGLSPQRGTSAGHAELQALTFSTEGSGQGLRKAFGVFVVLIALVPTSIVAIQWIEYSIRAGAGGEPSTGVGAVVPGALLALWGLWLAAYRPSVTLDPVTRTIHWRVSAFGWVLREVSWSFDEVSAIEFRLNSSYRLQGYSAVLTSARESRELLGYFELRSTPPRQIEDASRLLGLPLPNRMPRRS